MKTCVKSMREGLCFCASKKLSTSCFCRQTFTQYHSHVELVALTGKPKEIFVCAGTAVSGAAETRFEFLFDQPALRRNATRIGIIYYAIL